ncbi:MAG: hypothetical protein HY888_08700 [Deltaproteobacteria bacterium]|nr:hypothetical protein [Deltaproteobacteria bacterium]
MFRTLSKLSFSSIILFLVILVSESHSAQSSTVNLHLRGVNRHDQGQASAPVAVSINLNGVWLCNDGGTYYLRQTGNTLVWFGEHTPQNPAWSNVAQGNILGNQVSMQWWDVPKGRFQNAGTFVISINSNESLSMISGSGGFGGSTWRKIR